MGLINKSIEELQKSGFIKKGDDPSLVCEFVPLGIPSLDEMLGGGLPKGRAILNFGPESTGKTLISQYAAAAIQKTQRPLVLYMDLERSYDEEWWKQSGVDTKELLVSAPTVAEEAIDIMRSVLNSEPERLGLIIIDSIAAMVPAPEMDPEKSSEGNRQPGTQARVVTLMYRQVMPLLSNQVCFMAINQMRDSIGGYDEIGALSGGRAQRHYSHIILRTRRDDWIKENDNRVGFYMEFISRKNKVANTPDGTSIMLPFMFNSQFDWTTTYIKDGIDKGHIGKAGPYFKYGGKSHLGMNALREFLTENPEEMNELKRLIGV